jgi:plastocyanin
VYAMTGSRVVAHRPGPSAVPIAPPEPGGLPEAPVGYSVVAHPSSFATGYTTRVAPYGAGAEMTFHNGDAAPHDVVATVYGEPDQPWCDSFPAGKCPLFWSKLIGLGESTPILGLDRLTPGGTYPFFCTIHPSMRGDIVVLPAGGAAS